MADNHVVKGVRRWLGWLILLAVLPACVISTASPTETPTVPPSPSPDLELIATQTALAVPPTNPPPPTVTPLPDPGEGEEGAAEGEGEGEGGDGGNGGEGESSGEEQSGGDTNEPASQASPPGSFGAEVYSTDFQRGWPDETYEGYGTLTRADGGYELDVTFQALWAGTTVFYRNTFYAELEATPRACVAGQSWYGMIFSWRDNDHFRVFVVTCSGRWSLFERNSNNRALTLANGDLPGGVDASTGTHKLAANVNNNVATLWIDDYRLTQAGLTDMPVGDIGPYAETTGSTVNVLFTRLTIYEPGTPEE